MLRVGFNSATAVKPWKTPHVFPGHDGRAVELQFGHGGEAVENSSRRPGNFMSTGCFNSATEVKPWKTAWWPAEACGVCGLQFGHGGEAVENVANAWAGPAAMTMASIRPRR